MKNLTRFLGIIALATVIGFSMAACSSGGGGDDGRSGTQTVTYRGTADGVTYTLKITENTGRYVPQTGDSYELTNGTKNSTGTVDDVSGGDLTLKPSKGDAITVTVSGSGITDITGTGLRWDDDSEFIAPGTLIPPSGGQNTGSMNWTAVTDSIFRDDINPDTTSQSINAIAWGNGKFVAGGSRGTIAYSTDGIKWTADDELGNSINGIAWGNDKFVAVGSYGHGHANSTGTFIENGTMVYSADGITWTAVADSTFNETHRGPGEYDDRYNIYAIAWGNDKFVAGGANNNLAYSMDGITWTAVTNGGFEGFEEITTIAWGNGKFVAGGAQGTIAYSTDGVNWTAVLESTFKIPLEDEGAFITNPVNAIAWGNGKFVAGGIKYDGGKSIAYSTDGVNWTVANVEDYNYFSAIAWGGNRFVAAGGRSSWEGGAAYSTDGVNWTINLKTDEGSYIVNYAKCITWGNGKFVVGGYLGKIAYSSN